MTRHLTVLTGASRGLGLALAQQLLARGHRVLAIARRAPVLAAPAGGELISWQADLAAPAAVAEQLRDWLLAQDPAALASATLINNAGVISQPAPLSAGDPDELANALRVGLEAPLLLTAAFLHATRTWTLPRKVLLVSSGLGRRPMAGSAAYCAAKAGMDHLARAVALEEGALPNGARICSLAPGVVDTDMQAQLRGADPQLFPERERFADLHAGGLLDTPVQAAAKVLRVLDSAEFGSQPVADVRDLT
jgi:NAD(P)-dependent dehydrogenase (short-subunit alcohol dehydrogenase family)